MLGLLWAIDTVSTTILEFYSGFITSEQCRNVSLLSNRLRSKLPPFLNYPPHTHTHAHTHHHHHLGPQVLRGPSAVLQSRPDRVIGLSGNFDVILDHFDVILDNVDVIWISHMDQLEGAATWVADGCKGGKRLHY